MLTDREKRVIKEMCLIILTDNSRPAAWRRADCFMGSASVFRLGPLGHSGFRKRWKDSTRDKKVELARIYAEEVYNDFLAQNPEKQ
jgi:hypothetical protein